MCFMRLVCLRKVIFSALTAISLVPLGLQIHVLARAENTHAVSAAERAHIEDVLRELPRGMNIVQVAVAPDGKRLAWVEDTPDGAEILLAPIGDLAKRQTVTAASKGESCDDSAAAWSPDSSEIAFLSDCASEDGQDDLYLSHLDGQPARRITELNGYVHSLAFSPDGKQIAFLYVPGSMRPAGALAAQSPDTGVIGETHSEVQRIAVAQTNASQPAAPSLVSPAELHVYEFDWAPDSTAMAYIAADPPGENNWWVAKLYTEPIVWSRIKFEAGVVTRSVTGLAPRVVLDPSKVAGPLHGLQIAVPRWSPDGKRIAFIGGLMSDQGSTGGDVWIVSATGGAPRDVTAQRQATPSWIAWAGDEHLFVDEIAGGGCRLIRLTLHGGSEVRSLTATAGAPVFSFPGTVGDGRMERSLSATADRSLFVFKGSTFDTPMEIYASRPGEPALENDVFHGAAQISHFNAGVTAAWGKSVSVDWTSEGFHVQGWLTLPVNYDASKRYPLIVEVHGGPAAAALGDWSAGGMLSPSTFSALGYFVLQPNPRGSFGEGEAFTQANRKDFGYGDLRDILAGVDKVEAQYAIDANRVGITGWSYGGFMSMFALTQTQRFKASVAGAGISDWLSYYGENSIDQWMIPYFGASVYDDPAIYAKSSAINFIKRVHTPTLMAVGDRDGECPAPQSFEFWHALRDLGVPTELVVYPDEGHGLSNPEHERDVEIRTMEWFAKYMP
jgi:dipeptidyl aminopeptidase/acylaminoacyl peptidase